MQTICIALLVVLAGNPSEASLSWSWEYTEPNVFLGPTDSFEIMIQILNDISSTEELNIGGSIITISSDWWSYYWFDGEDISSIVLAPGESTSTLYGTFNPLGVVPVGTEFDFHSSIFIASPGGGFGAPQDAPQDLHGAVIPEPSIWLLVTLGTAILLKRR